MAKTIKRVIVTGKEWPILEKGKQNLTDRLFTDYLFNYFYDNPAFRKDLSRIKRELETYYRSTVDPFYASESTPRIKVGHYITHAFRHGVIKEVA